MNELIEKLKDNTTPYGLCSNEERATFESVGANNCRVYNFNGWGNSLNTPHKFSCQLAYQIKSDYQPEPEYADLEITTDCKEGIGLGVHSCFQCQLPRRWMAIHELPSLPGFRGFLDDKGSTLQITWIAERISRGQKVIARFDK